MIKEGFWGDSRHRRSQFFWMLYSHH